MQPTTAKRLRLLASTLSVLLLVALLACGWFVWRLRASLPQLDGTATVAGLGRAVTVERDALGVPTIRGESRADVARSLGWLHAQDRFFQMDLLRRSAAGELAELFGKRALPRDRAVRLHGFRKLAQSIVERLSPTERSLLEAYAAGANAGLGALAAHPFEYVLLRTDPAPWRPEDSLLVIYAMTLDLQDEEGVHERTLMTIRDQLGRDSLAFFAPVQTAHDAALDGTTAALPPPPGPAEIDLRKRKVSAAPRGAAADLFATSALDSPADLFARFPSPARDPEAVLGSNAFALAGTHTANGGAMLANDMHLDLGLPNIWYRASLEFAGRTITGVTLPGTPCVVAGSNGRVAWGFTNSCVDNGDLVVVELNSIAPTLYKSPDREDFLRIEERTETIRVKGGDPVVATYEWTIWGPIIGTDERGRRLAHRWTAHDPEATNLTLMEIEEVDTVAAGIAVAHRSGIPAQNIVLADRTGAVAWTIAGRLPRRTGYDGRLPVTWAYGDRKWDGFLPPGEVPVVTGDASSLPGRIWSANQRHLGGEGLVKLGAGGYVRATRAAQIRDRLQTLDRATEKDLLAIQLDDRVPLFTPWHVLLMEVLTPAVTAGKKRAELRAAAETWEDRARVEAVSYRLVREFRAAVYRRVFTPIFEPCRAVFPGFDLTFVQLEGALWTLLREKPPHLLNPEFATWEELLVAAVDDTIAAIEKTGKPLAQATWGARNRVQLAHPFSGSFSALKPWLSLPAVPLPGDSDAPRAQTPRHGASERLVVSPGREQEGIFHMPGGQSGHPLSPYFQAGHEAWVRGDPTPFLPGAARHTLTLRP